MSVANILLLVSIVLILILGAAILAANKKKLTNQLLAAFEFSAILWLGANLLTNLSKNSDSALLFTRSTLIGGALLPLFILLFAIAYAETKISKVLKLAIIVLPILILSFVPTSLNIRSVEAGGENLKTGPVYILVAIYIIIYSVATLKILWNKYRTSVNKEQKTQLEYILVGSLLTFVPAVILNAILPFIGIGSSAQYGPLSVAILAIFTAIAIIRHQFLNIRVIVARSLAYLLSVVVIVALFSVLAFGIASYAFKANLVSSEVIFFALFSVITALVFQPVKRFFDKASNRLFYRDAYDAQELMNAVNSAIVTNNDLYKLLESTSKAIKVNLKASFCNFYIDSQAVIDFHIVGTDAPMFVKKDWDPLLEVLNASPEKIFSEVHGIDEKTSGLMHDLNVEIILKMTSQNQNVGYLIVGQKQSGSSFTSQDSQVLEIIADEVAIAVQNTLRYEEIAQFNVTLQKKIETATGELQRSNEKLKALDEAKDEFISMASHQLRTPLTSVKGYISMLIEGDAGVLNDQQRRFLEQAYTSSQRMVYLIADLLNVSRLKTGKFIIETTPTYLPDVVESEVSQLLETAKARGLELIYHKPDTFPMLNLDETKTRQVIMNFADNAIYYTPKGGKITLVLQSTKDSVSFKVNDNGIGVPKADEHKMFTKFYRAGNARKARPDGTGLGLFMAKKVIVAQGGAIIFETKEGKGSTFGFSFPRNKVEATPVK